MVDNVVINLSIHTLHDLLRNEIVNEIGMNKITRV